MLNCGGLQRAKLSLMRFLLKSIAVTVTKVAAGKLAGRNETGPCLTKRDKMELRQLKGLIFLLHILNFQEYKILP